MAMRKKINPSEPSRIAEPLRFLPCQVGPWVPMHPVIALPVIKKNTFFTRCWVCGCKSFLWAYEPGWGMTKEEAIADGYAPVGAKGYLMDSAGSTPMAQHGKQAADDKPKTKRGKKSGQPA